MNKAYPFDVTTGYPRGQSTAQPPSAEGESLISVAQIVRAVRRRLSLMVAVFLVVFAVNAVMTYRLKPAYSATSSVIVNTRDQRVIDIGAVLSGMPADQTAIDTEAEVIRSRTLMEKVVRRLNLVDDPEFNWALVPPSETSKRIGEVKAFIKGLLPFHKNEVKAPEPPVDPAEAARNQMDGLVDSLRGHYYVNRLGSTLIIQITATSADPKKAAKLANTLADVYLSNQLDTKLDATRRAQSTLNERVDQMREDLRVAESKVEEHRARTGLLAAGGTETLNEQAIRDLNAQLSTAQVEFADKNAHLENIDAKIKSGGDIDTLPEAQNNPTILSLRNQQQEIAQKKAELLQKYGPKYPEVQSIQVKEADIARQKDAALRVMVASLQQDVMTAQARVRVLQSRLNQEKGELANNNRDQVELSQLQREADASKALYEQFLKRSKETNELNGLTEADATIASYAPTPGGPSFPNTKLNLMLGAMMGLALAGLIGLIAELMDRYLTTPEDVEQVTGAPYIGSIPLLPSTGNFTRAKMLPAEYLMEKPHSGFAEAYRHLRASIMFADLDKAAKTVAVVSSLPDEGKTSMTYCLGRMAAMSGTKTICIDGDLRRRQLTEISGVKAEHGLLEYLFGEARLADAVATDEKSGLHILPLSDRKHTPRDVFGSRAFDALLNMLQQTYDLILIDTGPILLMAETRVVTRKVDQVVVAARWRKTQRGTLKDTMKILRDFNANVAGVVLTFVDLRKRAHQTYSAANYKSYAKYYHD